MTASLDAPTVTLGTGPCPIRTVDLSKSYGRRSETFVLRDCTLEIPQGAIVGLVGENGSGKTTLLQCLVGLLAPTRGQAQLMGVEATQLPAEIKSRIGYVPQSTQLPPWLTVRQTVDYFGSFYGAWDAGLVSHLIERWRLPEDKKVGVLSGGQQQLASIIVALAHRPELLILDEPVAALDPKARRDFLTLLHELGEQATDAGRSQTVLFSTHLLSDLERTATHVALLKNGHVAVMEELSDLKESIAKLRITASQPLPQPPLSSISVQHAGQTIVATVTGAMLPHWEAWAEEHDAVVLSTPLSLEDLFVELG